MSRIPWLRLYTEARTDKKLALLTLAERGVWLNLLCYAAEQEERGTSDASDRYLLALECADGDEDVLDATIAKLLKVKHLTDLGNGRMSFRTFMERQYDKPSSAPSRVAERVARHRQRQDEKRNTHVTPSNATSADVTPLYTDTDIEGEITGKDSSLSTVSGPSGRTAAAAIAAPRPLAVHETTKAPALSIVPKQAPSRTQPARSVNPIWDALVSVVGFEPTTKTERSNWGKVVKELKEAGATPEDISIRAARYISRYGQERLTVNALRTHWSECATEPPKTTRNARAAPVEPPQYQPSSADDIWK